MLRVIDLRGRKLTTSQLRRIIPRGGVSVASVVEKVAPIVNDIQHRGAAAALKYCEQFDGIRPEAIRVPQQALDDAVKQLDPQTKEAIEVSIERVRKVHAEQKPASHTTSLGPDASVTEVFRPVERVGLYVPGGKAVYPSSVIMNTVPAQEAGASTLIVASPPQKEFGGLPHPTVLATCAILGVDEVWAVGGAQGIALLAYGDDEAELEPVDMVTGPGNIFVTAARRLVRGLVGTDTEAGPREIAVLADASANPVYVAYD